MFRKAWNYMFGGGGDDEDPKKPSPYQKSIDASQARISTSEKRQRELERKAAKERKSAQAYSVMASQAKTPQQKANLKKKGMDALKLAMVYEGYAAKTSGITANFETMTLETESIVATKDMVDGMKDMHGTMESLKTEIDPDAVADLMHNIQETTYEFSDAVDTLSSPLYGTVMMDSVDMENEFDAMVAGEDSRLQEEAEVAALRAMDTLDSPQPTPKVPASSAPPQRAKTPEEIEFEKMTTQVME